MIMMTMNQSATHQPHKSGTQIHKPVMCQEILDLFSARPGPLHFVDATFGRGGHTCALLDAMPDCRVTAIDCDPQAIVYGAELVTAYGDRLSLVCGRFSSIHEWVAPHSVAGIVFDFGVSSPQLDQAQRGFSFMNDGPLDMRMGNDGPCAADLVNHMREQDLANVIFEYGQEHASRRIARHIIVERAKAPITTTGQLSLLIQKIMPRRGKQHPATKTFQALRIAVNKELDEIQSVLPQVSTLLQPGGIAALIAFHSLEDRLVKTFFKESQSFAQKTKKPIRPGREEVLANPRARSACLRYGIVA
jgi:16S rRNA (cytosine1402-N4)-methyltransferase